MGRIIAKLPYVETVSVETQLPGTVVIEVTESQSLAWVELEGQRWVLDRSCKFLTQADTDETASLIRVTGVTPVNPMVGRDARPGGGRGHRDAARGDTRPGAAPRPRRPGEHARPHGSGGAAHGVPGPLHGAFRLGGRR